MADEKHLYLVASGGYVAADTPLAQEIWQFGIRLSFRLTEDPEPIGTLPSSEWDVVSTTIQRDETDWTIDGNWTIEGGVSDLDPGDYLNDQAAPAVETYCGNSTLFSSGIELRELRLYPISSPNGKVVPAPPYAQGSPCVLRWKTPPTGGASGAMLPPNVTVVTSTRTSQVGRRGRGRWYAPPSPTSIMATGFQGVLNTSVPASFAAAGKALLNGLKVTTNEPTGSSVRPVVIGAPYVNYAEITRVQVGNVADAQVRRRRSIPETYASESL